MRCACCATRCRLWLHTRLVRLEMSGCCKLLASQTEEVVLEVRCGKRNIAAACVGVMQGRPLAGLQALGHWLVEHAYCGVLRVLCTGMCSSMPYV